MFVGSTGRYIRILLLYYKPVTEIYITLNGGYKQKERIEFFFFLDKLQSQMPIDKLAFMTRR